MTLNTTGIILAGGYNSRLPGIKKAFHKIGGEMIMDSTHRLFSRLFNEVIIVTNDPESYSRWDGLIVTDIHPSRCSLAGIHAGLFYASEETAFVSACDTPFLKQALIETILSRTKPGIDVVIPQTFDGLEPLCAAYSKECLPLVEKNLENNIFMVKKFFRKKKVTIIPALEVKKTDPDFLSFFNINTQEDLEKARKIAHTIEHQP